MDEQILRMIAGGVKRKMRPLIGYLRKSLSYLRHPAYYSLCREAKAPYKAWNQEFSGIRQELVHPHWLNVQPTFAQLVLGGMPYDFLQHHLVRRMFCRSGFEEPQQHELAYLHNARADIWNLVRRYRESPIGKPTIDCPELGISVNSLGMLYYFVRITEQLDRGRPSSIMEFGAGYGCLCRVFLELLPRHPTYVIIDIPEMLALQYVFLRGSSDTYQVIAHTSLPIDIKENCVNLVPVHLIEAVAFRPDLFVSTFALSETPKPVHEIVARHRFFNAKSIYIVGQNPEAERWRHVSLESMDVIRCAAYDVFANVQLEPFHFADAWEIMAWSIKHPN
jgi:hypothetical protein